MALILKDRVQETSTTTGTGTLTLAGAVTQFQTFSSAVGNGNTTYYTIYNAGGTQWEVGLGTVSAGTLSRDTVLASSNSNALVSFTGTLYVFGDYPAGKAVYLDAIGTATVSQLATSSTTSTTPVLSYNASNSNYAAGATVAGSYLQTVMQNKSGTAGASTNYVLSNDLGTDSTYYGEFGMNSSVFSASTPSDFFSINNGIYYSGHDGDISIGSGNGYKTYFAWGTTGQSAHVINASGAIGLSTNLGTTPALSGTTGYGTSGQVLTSGGSAAAPTWTTVTSGITITDNTSSSSTYYPAMTTATSGTITGETTSSTKLSFVPSTGTLTTSAILATEYKETSAAISASAIDLTLGNYFTKTISGTTTFTISNAASSGTVNSFILQLTNGGSATVNWFSGVKWAGGTAPTLTASGYDELGFFSIDGGTTWQGFVLGKAMA